eukprot:1110332-Pelagomonas_calceolata.AAC.1
MVVIALLQASKLRAHDNDAPSSAIGSPDNSGRDNSRGSQLSTCPDMLFSAFKVCQLTATSSDWNKFGFQL